MNESSLRLLGENIRRIRLSRGLSQEGLAELSKLHRTYIGGIERGERNVSLINLLKISKALGVPLSQILKFLGIFSKPIIDLR